MKSETKNPTTTKRTTNVGEAEEKRLHDNADKLSEDGQVDLNSFDSFPASDSPSFSPTTTGQPSDPERDPRKPG